MHSFSQLRDRDAWSTIRGYVYQVDLTIQRWLELAPHQILELECGEDIDIVGCALVASSDKRDRLLEQVKHRDSSLTLKQPEAIAAIANFIEHRQTNPDAELFFLFTTNAKVGREQLSPMPKRKPAIEAWECLRLGKLEEKDRGEFLEGIRQILVNAGKPSGFHEDAWQRFCNFIQTATHGELFDLICKFEWRTEAPEARSLKSILHQQLLDRRHAIDLLQAEEQYQRLFLCVFRCLCERGRKQLTLEELNAQLALPSLSSNDHATLETLKTWSYEIGNRVTNLEKEQQQRDQLLNSLSVEVQQLAWAQGIDAAVNYVVETPILDVYPLAERPSLREETVQALAQTLANHTWIAIDGSLGSGKTQLAVLLVQYLIGQGRCKNCIWVRLRDLTVEQACLRFDRAVETLVGRSSAGNFSTWYTQLCDRLDPNTILVFDDLPRLARGDDLETRLTQLAQICHSRDIRLLSTSFHQLPQNLQSVLNSQVLYSMQVPPFTNGETVDLFRAYDAPEPFLNSDWIAYLNGLANYHPSLLSAIAEYLLRRNWQFTSAEFDALLQGDHTTGVNEETLNRILAAIQDDQSQELLYRLNLVLGYFSIEDMQALAEVSPSVGRPRQRLNNLLGVWIQRDINNRLMVSPLVKALGSQDLSISVRQECHLTLGERIVQGELNQYKAFNAIAHFTVAKAFNKAGTLLLFALDRLEDSETPIDDGGLLMLWSLQPLPEQIDLGIRILIRGFQISVCIRRNKSVIYLLDNLDSLVEQLTEQESVMAMALVTHLSSKCSRQIGFSRLNRYFQTALAFSSTARLPDGKSLSFLQAGAFESVIWSIASIIQSTKECEEWISTLQQLTSRQREQAFSERFAEAGCLVVADQIWVREASKPKAEQNWQAALATSHKLAETSSHLGLEVLWACAIRSEVVILSDYQQDLNQAIQVIDSAIAQASDDFRVQFLLKELLGRLFIITECHDKAVNYLTQALEQPTEAYPLTKLYALLKLSQVIADQEPYLAIQHAQQAVNLAQSSEEIPETELVKALGELAIAKWLAMDLSSAFEIWDQAGEYLLKCRREQDAWKDLFVIYAHITGYFTALARTGNPPDHTETGETYAAPTRGIFLTQSPARVDYYNPSRDCFLPTQLASLAEAIGSDERALAWAMRGIDMARQAQQFLPLTSLVRNIIPQLVLENRYAEVLDLAVEVGTLLMAIQQRDQSGGNILEPGIDLQSVLGSRNHEVYQQTESYALTLGVLPIIFHIANLAIRQPKLSRSQAKDLASMCREIAAISETQSLWTTVATLIDQVHLQQSTCVELISQYQNLSSPDMILSILGLMTATLQENAPLREVLSIHLSVIEQVQRLTNPQSTTWRKIILPYFFNYWKTSLEQVMFRFNDPQSTADLLYLSQNLPADQQGQAILNIIQWSLVI